MKNIHTAAVLTTIATLAVGLAATTATAAQAPTDSVDTSLAANLTFNREEERLAQDLYAALATTYDQARPMSMITRSETQHFDSIGNLLSTYGIDDPSAGLAAGSYAFPELQALYDDWLAKGSTSINAAYQVGVELEKRDIADLEKAIAATSEPDVIAVYERLLSASQRHLAAFERAVSGDLQPGAGAQGQMAGQGKGQAGAGQGQFQGRNGKGRAQGMNSTSGTSGTSGSQRGRAAHPQGQSGDCPLQS